MACDGCQVAAVQITTIDAAPFTASVTINVDVSIDKETWVEPRRSTDGATGWFNNYVYGANVTALLTRIDVTGFNFIRVRNSGAVSTGRLDVVMLAEASPKSDATIRTVQGKPYKITGSPSGMVLGDGDVWNVSNYDRALLQVTPFDYVSGTLVVDIEASLDGLNYYDAWSVYDVYPSSSPTITVNADGVLYPLIDCTCTNFIRARVSTTANTNAMITPTLTSKDY